MKSKVFNFIKEKAGRLSKTQKVELPARDKQKVQDEYVQILIKMGERYYHKLRMDRELTDLTQVADSLNAEHTKLLEAEAKTLAEQPKPENKPAESTT